MSGDDQERFKDYLELELFISELQAGHTVHPPHEMTPEQARIYRMAMLFHTATPEVSNPNPEFAAQLQRRLEKELQAVQQKPHTLPKKRVSRRKLLAGGAIAASVAVGMGVEHALDHGDTASSSTTSTSPTTSTNPAISTSPTGSSPTSWFFVTTVAELGSQAVQFKTNSLIGYVLRNGSMDNNIPKPGQIVALSAACTHMGCIVQWTNADRKFHCPCHGGAFTATGGPDGKLSPYLTPLAALDVKVENGQIYVRVPASI